MAEVTLTHSYNTNGVTIPKGRITTSDVKELIKGQDNTVLTDDAANAAIRDLQRREAEYLRSREHIMEKHTIMSNGGSIAVGGGAE